VRVCVILIPPSLASAARRRHRETELERWVVAAAGHVGSVVDEAEAVAPREVSVTTRSSHEGQMRSSTTTSTCLPLRYSPLDGRVPCQCAQCWCDGCRLILISRFWFAVTLMNVNVDRVEDMLM
jgi:hypothetical protein